MYTEKMVDALATVFRRFKPGSRANTETLIFLAVFELSTRSELITTHKIKKYIKSAWDRELDNSQIRAITDDLCKLDLIRIEKDGSLRIYELKDIEKLYNEVMNLNDGILELFGLIDEIVQLTETRYQPPPRVTENEILEAMIRTMMLTKESMLLRVGDEFLSFLYKCESVILNIEEMDREIRIVIPEGSIKYPSALESHIVRKKNYPGLHLNIDDGESILQIRKDGDDNLGECYIHNLAEQIMATSFARAAAKGGSVEIITQELLQ
ncbi:MAG: hypothetical protein ACTSYA_09770 [Candidatus Kariarchaeaceae archaeon]